MFVVTGLPIYSPYHKMEVHVYRNVSDRTLRHYIFRILYISYSAMFNGTVFWGFFVVKINLCFKLLINNNIVLFGYSQEATVVVITLAAWTRPSTARRPVVT